MKHEIKNSGNIVRVPSCAPRQALPCVAPMFGQMHRDNPLYPACTDTIIHPAASCSRRVTSTDLPTTPSLRHLRVARVTHLSLPRAKEPCMGTKGVGRVIRTRTPSEPLFEACGFVRKAAMWCWLFVRSQKGVAREKQFLDF